MGHYAGEMGYAFRRDVSWLKWGFTRNNYTTLLVCPVCYTTVPEGKINVAHGNTPDEYRLPWMEHILWHKKIQADGSTFGWQWPAFYAKDKQEGWDMGQQLTDYRTKKVFPGEEDKTT